MDQPYIRIRGLIHHFGENEVLRGLDLDIFRGETLAIIGGSGGGKSVLLKHLAGLLKPVHGSIQVDGLEIANLDERALGPVRRQMGILFQGGALFDSLTVAENVAFPLRESGDTKEPEIESRVIEALKMVRLSGQEDKLPSELSGGMRKRVALARAVVGRPTCVLYDEPQAGLDPINADSIDHLIKDLQRTLAVTSMVVTHDIRSVFHIADRIAFLANGKIEWLGTPQELTDTDNHDLRKFIAGDSGEAWK